MQLRIPIGSRFDEGNVMPVPGIATGSSIGRPFRGSIARRSSKVYAWRRRAACLAKHPRSVAIPTNLSRAPLTFGHHAFCTDALLGKTRIAPICRTMVPTLSRLIQVNTGEGQVA